MIIIGADHTGFELKKNIIEYFIKNNRVFKDVTDYDVNLDDDYPDVAREICLEVLKEKENLGIAICGTGIGISIACNKINGIRAALCLDEDMAKMSRKHNDANVLCLGARLKYVEKIEDVYNILDSYLNTEFEGARHERRLEKIVELEKNNLEGGKIYGNSI